MMKWFVVHTQARGEAKAACNLRNQGYDVYLPQYRKRRRHARRTDWVRAPLFPRYLFVRVDPARPRWRSIASTVGVSDLVRMGERPASLPPGVVAEIRRREAADGLIAASSANPLHAGEIVRIDTGAFTDRLGRVETLDDTERVTLLLDILGRNVKIRMPVDAVAACA